MKSGNLSHRSPNVSELKRSTGRKKKINQLFQSNTTKHPNNPNKNGGNNSPDILKQVFDIWRKLH